MVRKRLLASVLYEDDTFSDRNRNSRNRSISNILDEELTSNQLSSSSRLVLCNCPKCNGRLINPRTKVIHDLSNKSSEISIESFQNRQEIEKSKRINESSSSKSTTLTHTNQSILVEISNITTDDKVLNISSGDEMEEMHLEIFYIGDYCNNFVFKEISIKSEEESADEFSNIFEDYLLLNYDSDEPINPKLTNNNSYLWILLWIISFQIKFNLPETATESLIKFIKLLLSKISNSKFGGHLKRGQITLRDT
ncbi:hypothetical protein Glove_299g114 [Diversispora epigaea]|uniref:Uncharacterized protein n=1 Tax=Diversispora epigaea TaxID=1348612 RepID=A0A397I1X0_9GLOM|nr:hypothetical protein Glove_299g114 [Diversispora epigaea]